MEKEFLFAKRTQWNLEANEFIAQYQALKDNGHKLIDLTESNPTRCGFDYCTQDLLKPLSSDRNLDYRPSPQGSLESREAICQYYAVKGIELTTQQIFLTASTSEAYSLLFRLLANPGEHILFPKPSYPLFQFLVDLNDIEMDTYPLVYRADEKRWHIDLNSLAQAVHPQTKAIVLVNPNNPTGSFIKEEEWTAIVDLCQKENIVLICDEVFLDYIPEDSALSPQSLAGSNQVLTFVMGGLSKLLALPQMKISWVVVNGPGDMVKIAKERMEIICDTYLSVNTPAQNSLVEWLPLQSNINKQLTQRIRENKEYLHHIFSNVSQCEPLESEGGWYSIVRLPSHIQEEQWALDLLKNEDVFVHPGYFFDFQDEPYIVLSLITPVYDFQVGLKRIVDLVRLKENWVEK